jgi:hypothetical protein
MRRIRWLLLGLLLAWTLPASAQLPVIDAANLSQNTISATNLVINTAQWLIDLLPLEAYTVIEAMGEDLALLQELALQAQLIGMDIASIQAQLDALFGLESAPVTSFEWQERVTEINQRIWMVYGYAMRTQTLINTVVRTVEHILGLIEIVAELLGTLSVQQNISQQLAKLHQLQAESNVVTAAFAHAKSTEALAPGVLIQGIRNINDEMMSDHPRW